MLITYHDPCHYGRKAEKLFGPGYFEEPRWILNQCVEDWVELYPARDNQICCGGGGGFLQSGFKKERLEYGRLKDQQIQNTKADYCIAGCHNCHAQIHELSDHYGAEYGVVHLWTLICLSLGILGPNEREYLRKDMKDVNVFHPESGL